MSVPHTSPFGVRPDSRGEIVSSILKRFNKPNRRVIREKRGQRSIKEELKETMQDEFEKVSINVHNAIQL